MPLCHLYCLLYPSQRSSKNLFFLPSTKLNRKQHVHGQLSHIQKSGLPISLATNISKLRAKMIWSNIHGIRFNSSRFDLSLIAYISILNLDEYHLWSKHSSIINVFVFALSIHSQNNEDYAFQFLYIYTYIARSLLMRSVIILEIIFLKWKVSSQMKFLQWIIITTWFLHQNHLLIKTSIFSH